mmetsp:Transcript_5939/g.21738  ORF Transcript_5939/g.21738 Transcript_5939/m.21738 type:complete len:715 (-) Transcript_5939:1426-3570(-)
MSALLLRYPRDQPPLAVLAAIKLAGFRAPIETDVFEEMAPVTLQTPQGPVVGASMVLRFVANSPGNTGVDLYPVANEPFAQAEVESALRYAEDVLAAGDVKRACNELNAQLVLRTYLTGSSLSIADLLVWQVLKGAREWNSGTQAAFAHLFRWYSHCEHTCGDLVTAYAPKRGKAPQGGASGNGPSKAKGGSEGGSFDIKLPGAEVGKVCTRFPPEPSGYLHIGHTKAALLNEYFARSYKGKLILRFDDTNPSKEKDEFVENIMKDLATLDITPDEITYTSNYFQEIQELCEKLIKEGKFYVDDTPHEQMKEERLKCIESRCRDAPVETNLALWEEMKKGTERGQECAVRVRLDMQSKNGCLRDPVMYRCNLTPHHRTGTRFKAYPVYDFACPYVDSTEGVTHALRSSEYHDRNPLYEFMLQLMNLRKVHMWDFSRLNFVYTCLSKRKLQWFVDQGLVDGWNDPRFPTVQGIVRRGMTVEALKQFILLQGASKNLNLMEWDKLWTINKKIIDPVSPRYTAVLDEGKVPVTLLNGPATPEVKTVLKHKKNPDLGIKSTVYSKAIWLDRADAEAVKEGEEVTLMDWGNAFVRKIVQDGATGRVVALEAELNPEGSVKSTKLKLTWLAQTEELVSITLVEFDNLITKKKIEEDDTIEEIANRNSRFEKAALGDANMRMVKKGDILQLERKGYYRCDSPYLRPEKPLVLFSIPDGRQK